MVKNVMNTNTCSCLMAGTGSLMMPCLIALRCTRAKRAREGQRSSNLLLKDRGSDEEAKQIRGGGEEIQAAETPQEPDHMIRLTEHAQTGVAVADGREMVEQISY